MTKRATSTLLILGTLISLGAYGANYNRFNVSKISQEFNLQESDVQAVIDAVRDENIDMKFNRSV